MLCFRKQVGIYGRPHLIISDKGSQLIAAGKEVKEWESLGTQVQATGTEWRYTPTACPWRNGQAERCIGLAKHTLLHLIGKHEILNFVELETTLIHVAELLNRRPIAARHFNDHEFHPICPADLLLGRVWGYQPVPHMGEELNTEQVDIPVRLKQVELLVNAWWQRWSAAAFILMCPRRKWTQEKRSLVTGDIVLLKTDSKLGKGEYRLGKVLKTWPDEEGIVRTVTLGMRKRRGQAREGRLVCQQGLEESIIAVQRLVVIQAAEENQ